MANVIKFPGVAKGAGGRMTREEAVNKSVCIDCKADIDINTLSDIDQREFHIFGVCPMCWNKMFEEDEEY